MHKHCKGCRWHHNAGHPKTASKSLQKYNNFCTRMSACVSKDVIGHCKLMVFKTEVEEVKS